MARKLQIVVTASFALASLAFVLRWLWRWIQIVLNSGGLGIMVDAAGRPLPPHPAVVDTFPYFTVTVVCGLCAVIVAMVPDPEHFSLADMLFATMLVACALTFGIWLAG